ncbi:hypothetical protein EDB19DRAFT_2040733 [Suillus lakei]|nr:hypothetical protein EDB19DRAFT_2040733 [Suillus lakei]
MYSEFISASQASWTSTLKGNIRWMAPELVVPAREDGPPTRPSEQSDIFSVGGIMLQVLTNKVPYYYLSNDAAIVLCIARSEKPSRSRFLYSLKGIGSLSSNVGLLILGTVHRRKEPTERSGTNFFSLHILEPPHMKQSVYNTTG